MKAPSEKLRKRKESNNSDSDDVMMSAESALLMEQILAEEKVCGVVLGPIVEKLDSGIRQGPVVLNS